MKQTTWYAAYNMLQGKGLDVLTTAERELHRLPIIDIQTMEALFQPRQLDDETSKSGAHIGELVRVLKAGGGLPPIAVLKAGRVWWCVDGHHRLEAYRMKAAEHTGRGKRLTYIPVRVLRGSLADAFDVAVEENSQDKLNMNKDEKLEAAWQRVVLGAASASRISEVTTISERTVCTMRRALERAKTLHSLVSFETWTWAKVKFMLRNVEPREGAHLWDEAKAGEWSRLLAKTFCGFPAQHPRVFAQALLKYDAEMAKVLAGELAGLVAQQQAQKTSGPTDF